jgi:DHA1 family multidrug resistance protein-like MFS transporter
LRKFRENDLEIWLFLFFALGFCFLGIPILGALLIGLFINVLVRSVLRVVVSSRVAGIAGPEKRGEIMGIMASILALSNIGGPIIAGFLYQINNSLPFWMSALSLVLAFVIMKYCCSGREVNFNQAIAREPKEAL